MATSFVLFAIMISVALARSSPIEDMALQKKIQECFSESKIPDDLQKDLAAQLDNPKFKCFSACMMKKKGTMKHGKIDPELQLSAQPESYDTIKVVVSTCSDMANQQSNECEVAYSYVQCLIHNVGTYQG